MLVQVVEDMEEGVLRAGQVLQILYIVYNQGVDALIEVEEIVDILSRCGGVLALEETGGYI